MIVFAAMLLLLSALICGALIHPIYKFTSEKKTAAPMRADSVTWNWISLGYTW